MKHRIYRFNQTYYHYKGLLEKHNLLISTYSFFPGWYEYIEVYEKQGIKNYGNFKTPFDAYKTLKKTGIINNNNNKPNKN